MVLMMAFSIIFFISKIVLASLIKSEKVRYEAKTYLSFGIAVKPGDFDAWYIAQTFLPDIVSIFVSFTLGIGCIIRRKNSVNEFDDENIMNMKVSGVNSPSFWIVVYIIL